MSLTLFETSFSSPLFRKIVALSETSFPRDELFPHENLARDLKECGIKFHSIFNGGKFLGYFASIANRGALYLMYFAIVPEARGLGFGREATELLKSSYPNKRIYLEIERADLPSKNARNRKRRRDFYLQCGFHSLGLGVSYLGVEYEILAYGSGANGREFRRLLSCLADEAFSPIFKPLVIDSHFMASTPSPKVQA